MDLSDEDYNTLFYFNQAIAKKSSKVCTNVQGERKQG